MTIATSLTVETVRSAARELVRRLGFLHDDLAESGLPASAVHALIEIGRVQRLTAKDLRTLLGLEKSSVSRMLRKLVEAGLLQERPDGDDARAKQISLTPAGAAKLAQIDIFARQQVAAALDRMTAAQAQTVVEGLQLYTDALSKAPEDQPSPLLPSSLSSPSLSSPSLSPPSLSPLPVPPLADITSGYRPGLIGRCSDMHARYYAHTVDFGQAFEAIVATGLAEFCGRIEHPGNRIWTAISQEQIVGTVAIDGEDLNRQSAPGISRIAHLRWFIVDDGQRGSGLGRRLLTAALAFVDDLEFTETHLWTFRGLDAARKLYEAHGFVLAEEYHGRQWGSEVMEQKFVRARRKNEAQG